MKAVLFDMDGTLLPMDQDIFVREYFGAMSKKMSAFGYEPKTLVDAIWMGTAAMVKNDGKNSNAEVFWEVMKQKFGERVTDDIKHFDAFYENEFLGLKKFCGYDPLVGDVVKKLKAAGKTVVLASNPIFPTVGQKNRVRFAGVDPELFDYVTAYENSHYCKPNPDYYREIFSIIGINAEDCLMVGNDVQEDMIAKTLGAEVFLIEGCVLNRDGTDINEFPHGSFADLSAYIAERMD